VIFLDQINQRLNSIELDSTRSDVWAKYGDLLFGSRIKSKEELTEFQVAFLSLLSDNWNALIVPTINKNVIEEFDSWYEEEGSYNEIRVHSFNLKNLEQGDWEVTFEDDNIDLVVHMYMKGWDLDHTARTG